MWQLEVLTTDEKRQAVEDFLETQEILSLSMLNAGDDVILEQEINELPSWSFIKVEALFETQEQAFQAQKYLENARLGEAFSCHEVDNKNWVLYSLKDFQPIEVADKLWIFPHWLVPEHPQEPYLVIDPGFAFGTGQHATTKMCLEALIKYPFKNSTMIDYGCGSGILALAALKLGASKVYGVDIDPQACEASIHNAALNHITENHLIIGDSSDILPEKADILVANIVMNPLLQLKDLFKQKLVGNGHLILSGLLSNQLATVVEHYQTDFELLETIHELDWGCLVFQKK
jgi:ribosomal protein L11 methyltransferase